MALPAPACVCAKPPDEATVGADLGATRDGIPSCLRPFDRRACHAQLSHGKPDPHVVCDRPLASLGCRRLGANLPRRFELQKHGFVVPLSEARRHVVPFVDFLDRQLLTRELRHHEISQVVERSSELRLSGR
jgi:hypothetical protein